MVQHRAGAASIVGLIVTIGSVISGWHLKRLQADIHAATQATLTDMRKGFSDSQQTLGEAVKSLGQILERMDRAAEDRHRELKDRLGGRAEA